VPSPLASRAPQAQHVSLVRVGLVVHQVSSSQAVCIVPAYSARNVRGACGKRAWAKESGKSTQIVVY
jgi:hypothetical protein